MASLSPEAGTPAPAPVTTTSAPSTAPSSMARETVMAVKNAALLTLSLVGTLGVAVAVRIWMPRFLGPGSFGVLHFAEEFAAACLFFTTLGVEVHIKKEVSTRPEHASEFFGGLIQARLAATLVVFGAMACGLWAMGKTALEWELVYLFGLGQVAFVLNTSFASCLQARGTVRELAVINVVSKLVWGASVVTGLWLGGGLRFVALSFLITEAMKVPVLHQVCRRHLGLVLRFEWRPMLAVLGLSMPYYLNQLTHEIYARTGVTMMSTMTTDAEVGWFGAANHVKTLVLLALPIINAVVLPMASRIARESPDRLNEMMSTTVRIALSLATPLAIVLALNATDIVQLLYSAEYAPAARNLVVLSALIPLACFCVLASMHLLQLGKIWTVTVVSALGLVVNLVATPVLISEGHTLLGAGGGGVGAALAAAFTELTVAIALYVALGHRLERRALSVLALRLLVLGAVLAVAHVLLAPLGVLRLALEAVLCAVVGTALKAIPLREILNQVRAVYARPSRGG